MLMFSLGVAGSFSLGSLVANEISPLALTAARFTLGAAIIGAVIAATRTFRVAYARGSWRYFLTGGLMAIYFVLMFEGLKTASAVSIAAVFTLTPILSAVFGRILLGQVTSLHMGLALAIGGCGAIWVIFRAEIEDLLSFRIGIGEAIFFFGCVAHALYTPLARKLSRGEPPFIFVLGMLTSGAILLIVIAWNDLISTDWLALPLIVWITLAYITVIASILTFAAVAYATLRLPSAKVMAYTYLTPSWVIIWEAALGHGLPKPAILAGVLATVAALAMLLREEE